jgi:hypothetical protein
MKTTNFSLSPSPRVMLPSDLRAWTDQGKLLNLVLQHSTEAQGPLPRPGNGRRIDGRYPAPMLLALLAYCYAIGVYASREIERLTYTDETVRYLAVNSHPSGEDIRRFRRSWRASITHCLTGVLNAIWIERFGSIVTTHGHGNRQPNPQLNLATSDHPMTSEAENRLNRAVQYDCADWDE